MPGAIEKASALLPELDLHIYGPASRDDVLAFRCASYGDKAAKTAEDLIHKAVDQVPGFGIQGPFFVIARYHGELVGAVVFGLENPDDPAVTIFTLGVALSRQRQGIGTALKKIAMATAVAMPSWPNAVASNVHRTNYKMNGLNDNLGIARDPDPKDGEFFITGATVEMVDGDVRVAE